MNIKIEKINLKSVFLNVILLILSVLIVSCTTDQQKIFAEKKTIFKENRWNRFQYITHEIIIQDTISPFQIELEIDYLPSLSTQYIPIIFSIISPDSAQSHIRTNLDLSKSTQTPFLSIIHPQKYFNQSGKYTFQFFQKTSQYDIEGVKSITLRIIKTQAEKK